MDKEKIISSIGNAVGERGCFIVDVTVSRDNDIVLTIEKETGDIDLEDCVSVNDAFLAIFDKDAEDYSLTGWYDDLGYAAGGRIRILIAVPD